MRAEWTELMFLQIRAGNTAMYVFALAAVSVFLALAALYESWTLPLAVILVVPLCLLCSVSGVLYTGREVNIFVQIGLVVLVGLACKNAILIVEYAKQLHQEGEPRYEATVEACRLRLRPILMTSFAFIFGVLPLVVASGAGAEMRRSLGIAVFSGMLGVTVFGIFLTPVFFCSHPGARRDRLVLVPRSRWAARPCWVDCRAWRPASSFRARRRAASWSMDSAASRGSRRPCCHRIHATVDRPRTAILDKRAVRKMMLSSRSDVL